MLRLTSACWCICLTTSLSDLGGFLNFGVGWQGMLVISCCITVSRIVEGFDLTNLNFDLVKRVKLQWTDLWSGSLGRTDAISITKRGPKRSFPLHRQCRCCPFFFLLKKTQLFYKMFWALLSLVILRQVLYRQLPFSSSHHHCFLMEKQINILRGATESTECCFCSTC